MIWRGEAHHQGEVEVADPQGGRGVHTDGEGGGLFGGARNL
jgi:hypothetical protein